MDPVIVGLISIIVLFVLVLLGVHVGVSLGIVSVVGIFFVNNDIRIAESILETTFYASIKDYVFAVVPLYIMMGVVLSKAGLSQELFDAANIVLGRIRGGLALSTVAANAVFAAIVGSSIASAATFSKIAMGPMDRLGYARTLSLGTIAGSSVLGMLIPPSILFIVYGILTQESIGKLFMAGVIPGILLATVYSIGIIIMIKMRPELVKGNNNYSQVGVKEKVVSILRIWPVLFLIILVLGGIYGGFMTPTEAGGVGAAGAFLLALALKRLNIASIKEVLIESCLTTGSILFLLITAQLYSRMIAVSGTVSWLQDIILRLNLPPVAFILMVMVFVFFLGMIIDSTSILLLIVPLVFPTIKSLGIDPIWFGVVLVITVEMGLISPPFGISVFTVKACLGNMVTLEEVFSSIVPFLLMMILVLAILIAFPVLSTWLPYLK